MVKSLTESIKSVTVDILILVLVLRLVSVLVPKSSASRNFEKFSFNQCYRLAVYRL